MGRFLLAAALLFTGVGGKIKWTECKTDKELEPIQADCKKNHKPLALYFRDEENADCKKLEADQFSNDDVVKAAEPLARVVLEFDKHPELAKKLKVEKVPTLLFLDPEGVDIGLLIIGKPDAVVEQFHAIAEEYTSCIKWRDNREKALKEGAESDIPVVLFFMDDQSKSADAKKGMLDFVLKEMSDRFIWVKVAFDPKAEETKKLGISVSTLWVVEPKADDPMAKPLRKISVPKSASSLKADLALILKQRAEAAKKAAEQAK